MTVLITGGAGYIGSHTNKYLSEHGISTVVLDNLSTGHEESLCWGTYIQGDINDETLLDEIFTKYKFDAVCHFAGFASITESLVNPSIYYDNNLAAMKTLLDKMVEHHVQNIIFSSSSAVFGQCMEQPITENCLKNPINPYGRSKLAAEWMLKDFHSAYGLNYTIFRYFNVAGDSCDGDIGESHDKECRIIQCLMKKYLCGEQFTINGGDYDTPDRTCIRDYIHVTDIADAHYRAIDKMLKTNESYEFNLGSGVGTSLLQIVQAFEKHINKPVNYTVVNRRHTGEVDVTVAGIQQAKNILNWNPTHSNIDTIIQDAYNWETKRKY